MESSLESTEGTCRQPQWSPVLETGNGPGEEVGLHAQVLAAMEPGLGDREWVVPETDRRRSVSPPQWSPVLETGNGPGSQLTTASLGAVPQWSPVLETGNGGSGEILSPALVASRNGARSWRPGMGAVTG